MRSLPRLASGFSRYARRQTFSGFTLAQYANTFGAGNCKAGSSAGVTDLDGVTLTLSLKEHAVPGILPDKAFTGIRWWNIAAILD